MFVVVGVRWWKFALCPRRWHGSALPITPGTRPNPPRLPEGPGADLHGPRASPKKGTGYHITQSKDRSVPAVSEARS